MRLSAGHLSLSGKMDAVIRFFFYILIFWLPYSPAVIEICVVVSLGLWIVKRAVLASARPSEVSVPANTFTRYIEAFKPPASPLNKSIFFFILVCVLSVTGSAFWEQSWHNFFTKTLEWFIVYFLIVEVFRERKHVYIALAVFGVTAVSTSLDSLVQFHLTHRDIFLGHTITPGERATAGFNTSNGLGGYLALAAPLALSLIFGEWKDARRYGIALILCFFVFWSLAVTFSRGAWLGAFCGALFILLTHIFFRGKKIFYLCVSILFMITLLGVVFLMVLKDSPDVGLVSRHETAQWRMGIWRDSLKMIADRPLFGHGVNTFMRLFDVYRRDVGSGPSYAHNCYLQLTAETGIIGLLGFLWVVGEIFAGSLSKIAVCWTKNKNFVVLSLGLLGGLFAFLVHSFFDTNFYSLQLSVYFWFMAAVLIVFTHSEEEKYV